MSKANEYTIWTIADLLAVPGEARERCLHELGYALALHELAFGDRAQSSLAAPIVWTDDGDNETRLLTKDGQEILRLSVTEREPEIELTPEGRAIAAAYKKRQEEGNGHH